MSALKLPRPIAVGLGIILILTAAYVYVYQADPFPAPWSDVYLNLGIIFPALLSAYLATLVWRSFQRQDGPRGVWLYFTLALWSWAVAEIAWFWLWLQSGGEVPTPSLADVFYLLALPLFTASFVLQYRLVYHPSRKQEWSWLGAAVAAILAASGVGTWLLRNLTQAEGLGWGGAFLEVFYVVFDLAMMVAALGLARAFGRGLWGRMWWGLLAFALSDGLYSYLVNSGIYIQSAGSGSLLNLATDCIYALAYMLMALACWSQLLLVWYGPGLVPPSDQPVAE